MPAVFIEGHPVGFWCIAPAGADAIQDQMLTAIETTYSDRNAKARYEGDVVHIALDGDAEQSMAGFSECRVFTQLVKEGSPSSLNSPME